MHLRFAAAVVVCLLSGPATVYACTIGCIETRVLANGSVPQNAPALRIYSAQDAGSILEATLIDETGGESVALFATEPRPGVFDVSPDELLLDNTYLLESAGCLVTPGSFLVTPAAPIPDVLGTIEIDTPSTMGLPFPIDGCTVQTATVHGAIVSLTMSPDAIAWADVLEYTLLVDGVPWKSLPDEPHSVVDVTSGDTIYIAAGGSFRGRGEDFVYASCDTSGLGLTPEPHTIQLLGSIPGGPDVLSDAVTVDLTCPLDPPDIGPPDAGPRLGPPPIGNGGIDSGCSVSPVGSDSRNLPFVIGAIVLALGRRKLRAR